MVAIDSTAPDITEGLPANLSTAGVLSQYPPDAGWDVTFGPLGFLTCPAQEHPYERATEQVRKQQIDTSDSPGEQSLSSWWVRSQANWSNGAGIRWFEPGTDKGTADRFSSSYGVDPWTPGELTLLKRMGTGSAQRSADVFVGAAQKAGVDGYVEAYGTTITWVPITGTTSTATLPGGLASQPATAGGVAWVGHTNGVSKYALGSSVTTPLTCVGNARVWWVKARLVVAIGPVLYEVAASATGTVEANNTSVMFTHPDSSWVWTDVTETAGAILATGYTGGDSAIFRFTIENDDTGTPVLSKASQVGRTPPGERITCMSVYLGTTLVLGTSQGVRVGQVSESGDVKYGPLSVETPTAVQDVTFRDRFAYLAVSAAQPGGWSGAVRVDLSTPTDASDAPRFAWAWDVPCPVTGDATSLSLVGSRVVVAADRRTYFQDPSLSVTDGWIDTGRIRFGTVEPKAFRLIRAVTETNGGTVAIRAVDPSGTENRVVDFNDQYRTESDVGVQVPNRPINQWLSFKVYLTPSPAGVSPVLSALSVKAVPAASRVRLIQFPVQVYDQEQDRHGWSFDVDGGAFARLAALEALEESSLPILVQDHRTGEAFTGQIDSVTFSGVTAPKGPRGNFGGTALVQVRRL